MITKKRMKSLYEQAQSSISDRGLILSNFKTKASYKSCYCLLSKSYRIRRCYQSLLHQSHRRQSHRLLSHSPNKYFYVDGSNQLKAYEHTQVVCNVLRSKSMPIRDAMSLRFSLSKVFLGLCMLYQISQRHFMMMMLRVYTTSTWLIMTLMLCIGHMVRIRSLHVFPAD
ncbi:hypothetical protein BJV82DRAFT_34157 [Fennellomyces sp. T-0311]|nr:hypothetical protein BJV82DRAFT_34157 [Fennellomyces sp. T-0311]